MEHINEDAVQASAAKIFPANSIAFVVRSGILNHTLPIALVPFRASANQDIKILTPSVEINPNWLLYALLGRASDIWQRCRKHGTTVASIDFAKLGGYRLAVPLRSEQDDLASRIQATAGQIDLGERALVAAESRMRPLGMAMLSRGLSGRLGLYSEAITSELSAAPQYRLAQKARIQYGWTSKSLPEGKGPKFLRITDIQDGKVDWGSVPHCEIPPGKHDAYALTPGDIVFARSGATVGKSYLIADDVPKGSVFASYLIRVQTGEDLLPGFLAIYFQSSSYWAHIRAGSRGMAQPNFNGSMLGELFIPVPSLSAQEVVMHGAENMLGRLHELRRDVTSERSRLSALRRSVYQCATSPGQWPR